MSRSIFFRGREQGPGKEEYNLKTELFLNQARAIYQFLKKIFIVFRMNQI